MPRRPIDDPLVSAFGAAVRRRRTELGMSQERFAEIAGLHWTYIGGVERGERNVSLRNIGRIATALGIAISDLFADPEFKRRRP